MVKLAECDEEIVRDIEDRLCLPHLIARILCSRGMRSTAEIESFLSPQLEGLSDPLLLPDMDEGVTKTIEVLQRRGKIALFGDYDADGITSVALLVNFLKQAGAHPDVYLPTRTS